LEHTDWQVRGIGKCRRLSFDRGHHRPQVLRGVRVICGGRPHTRQRRHVAQLEIRAALRAGKLPDDALVFPAPLKGGYQSPRVFSKEWADVAESIGVPEVTFQALRHTHASQLIDAGVDIVTISKRLGHASPNITLKVHAHLFRKDDSKASDAIDAALEAPGAS